MSSPAELPPCSMTSDSQTASEFDALLLRLSEAGTTNLSKRQRSLAIEQYCRLSLNFAAVEIEESATNHLDLCFSPSHAQGKRIRIAICMFRLVRSYPDFVTVEGMSPGRLIALFDETLSETPLYRQSKVDPHDQTFRKQDALFDTFQILENDLANQVSALTSLSQLVAFRSSYLKKMRSSLSKLMIQPMIPERLGDQRIDGLISVVQNYLDAANPDVVRLYEEALGELNAYISEVQLVHVEYLSKYCLPVASNLLRLIKIHFEGTSFSRPADVKTSLSEKKYPLFQEDARLEIVINVLNYGPGYAHDVQIEVNALDDLEIYLPIMRLGGMHPTGVAVSVPARVIEPSESRMIEVICTWRNQDGEYGRQQELLELTAQRSDIDWSIAATEDPYSLAPIRTADELIGRTEILNRLIALTKGPHVESAFIRGQKRVGKTSIAKALSSRLQELFPNDYVVVYLEAGDYVTDDGRGTIQSLGRQICKAIIRSDVRFSKITVPEFDGALSPITDFFQDALTIVPACRMLIILDEFDELPLDLYRRGLVGDAFFRTLRSLSNKDEFGFVLVGSEKMEFVLSCQGDALNKFTRISVDYFDQEQNWNDFQDLIRRPAASYLEFAEPAVNRVYEWCAGNPYFAKLICQVLFQMMVELRDNHVTPNEVDKAVDRTLAQIGSNSFQHFWQDAISEPAPQAEEISIIRRKVLLAFGECLRRSNKVTRDALFESARNYQLMESVVAHELREYERRNVLVFKTDRYDCKVQLFSHWLASRGFQEIMTTFVDHDSLVLYKQQQEMARVKDGEILALTDSWGLYQGRRVTPTDVRVWLDQFKEPNAQRAMFTILEGLRFYSTDRIREKMGDAHRLVMRGTTWKRLARQPRRRDVVISALGGFAKSGVEYARRYADENQVFQDNVVELIGIRPLLEKREGVQAIVFLDDFIGTGRTLVDQLKSSAEELRQILDFSKDIRIFIVCVTGFIQGQKLVENELSRLNLNISLHVCDSLDESHRIFSNISGVFTDEINRNTAKDIAYEYGVQLVSNAPLGFGDSEAAIVFDNTIPNNSLPILWQRSKKWIPLFPRP